MKNILLWIKERIRLTFGDILSFSATASRGDFFTIFIVNFIIMSAVLNICGYVFDLILPKSWVVNISWSVAIISFIYLQLANICRRLNDLGKNLLLALLIFIPGLNILFELYLLFAPGKDK